MNEARRRARIFVMIFAIAWIKLIGRKSLMSSAPSFFGIRMMLALLSKFRFAQRELWKELMAAIRSYLIVSQQCLKNMPVKPSGPGALFFGV